MSTRPVLVGPLIHLGTLAPFRLLSHQQLGAIALETDEVVYAADSWIFAKGDSVRAMSMILDGFAEVVQPDGITTITAGTLVGFPDILTSRPVNYGVRARGEVVALRLGTDELRDLCEHNYAILSALLTHLSEQVGENPVALRSVSAGSPDPRATPLADGELDRVDRILALHRAPAFPSESMDALAELAGHVEQVDLAPGGELWERDARADQFAVVCRGAMDLETASGDVMAIDAGGVVGLPETLSGGTYRFTARARGAATVLTVDLDPFMDVVEDHFEMGYSILGWLAGHLIAGR